MYDFAQRLNQTLATLVSIRQRVPDVRIALIEMSVDPLDDETSDQLCGLVDWYVTLSHPSIDSPRLDAVGTHYIRQLTELTCLREFLAHAERTRLLADVDRVFKLSGRYWLTDDFALDRFDVPGAFVLKHAQPSKINTPLTGGIPMRHTSRLWSFETSMLGDAQTLLDRIIASMQSSTEVEGRVDLDHLLFHHVPKDRKHTLYLVGVAGDTTQAGERIVD
ncbi:hypothetical protein BH11PSE13_BH11PSE13_14390 [soil metagenome]